MHAQCMLSWKSACCFGNCFRGLIAPYLAWHIISWHDSNFPPPSGLAVVCLAEAVVRGQKVTCGWQLSRVIPSSRTTALDIRNQARVLWGQIRIVKQMYVRLSKGPSSHENNYQKNVDFQVNFLFVWSSIKKSPHASKICQGIYCILSNGVD